MESLGLRDLILLLTKPSYERKPADLQVIFDETQNIKFFQGQPQEVHLACCKVMKAVKYESDAVIFNKGDPGDSFCVILQGSVNVLVPQSGSRLSDVSSLRLVSVLTEGQAFGELSLLQNRDRAATIQCREETTLAVLGKNDFNRILRINEERRLHEKIHFFQSLSAFSQWSEMQLSRFVYYFQEEKCHRGAVIFRQGETSTKVYIVIAGEFRFTEDSELKSEDDSRHHRELQLVFRGPKEMFGEEEVLTNRIRQNTCTCYSYEGSLYSIHKEEFLKYCQHDSTLRYLNRYEKAKKLWMDERRPAILKAESAKMSLSFRTKVGASKSFGDVSVRDLSSLKQDLVTYGCVKSVPRQGRLVPMPQKALLPDRSAQHVLRSDSGALKSLMPMSARSEVKDETMRKQFYRLVKLRSLG